MDRWNQLTPSFRAPSSLYLRNISSESGSSETETTTESSEVSQQVGPLTADKEPQLLSTLANTAVEGLALPLTSLCLRFTVHNSIARVGPAFYVALQDFSLIPSPELPDQHYHDLPQSDDANFAFLTGRGSPTVVA